MGMFDTLVVHDNFIDNSPVKGDDWQTKSLACEGNKYEITSEGRLMLTGSYRTREGASVDQEMHGYVTFYTIVGKVGDPDEKWLEYTAKFTDGRLVEITANHKDAKKLKADRDDMCKTLEEINAKGRYCDECRVEGHDTCSMTEGCPCCENTRQNQ